jgi:uncharacterized damage-inducible protein DinB
MTGNTITAAPLYKGWDNYQQLLLNVITPLSDEQLALRVAPHLRSIGEITTHIIGTRAGWWNQLMGEGDAAFAALADWNRPDAPVQNAATLVKGLETTWQVIQETLLRWTLADLEHIFQGTHRGEDYSLSRQWIIWHVIEHDLHHGGELSFSLGMHGLPAIDI